MTFDFNAEIDLNSIPESAGTFTKLPDGEYNFEIVQAEILKLFNEDDGHKMQLTLKVRGGDEDGQQIGFGLNLWHLTNAKSAEIAASHLKKIGEAVKVYKCRPSNLGKEFIGKVFTSQLSYKGNYPQLKYIMACAEEKETPQAFASPASDTFVPPKKIAEAYPPVDVANEKPDWAKDTEIPF